MAALKIMGIINLSEDSFYQKFSLAEAIQKAEEMCREGVDIIDIGAESTRPGATPVPEKEELNRIKPFFNAIAHLKVPLSIDTYKPAVASYAIAHGATLINDITGFENPQMRAIARETDVELCVMHMQGSPQTMQQSPSYPEGVILHLYRWFEKRCNLLLQEGIKASKILIDPGIGFGKTVEDNIEIFRSLAEFKKLGFRILIGGSRKSFMSKILFKETSELLPATLIMHTIASLYGVDMIRVHDIGPHADLAKLTAFFRTKN